MPQKTFDLFIKTSYTILEVLYEDLLYLNSFGSQNEIISSSFFITYSHIKNYLFKIITVV